MRPNAADVERPYIERNIDATRQAYRLGGDWVEYRDYPGVGTKSSPRRSGGRDHDRRRPAAGPERALAHLHPAAAAQEFLQLPPSNWTSTGTASTGRSPEYIVDGPRVVVPRA